MRDDAERWFPVLSDPLQATKTKGSAPGGVPINWFGVDPDARGGRIRVRFGSPIHWLVLLVSLYGLALLAEAFYVGPVLDHYGLGPGTPAEEAGAVPETIDESAVVAGLWQSAIILVGIPLAWVVTFHRGGFAAAAQRLRLRSSDLPADLGIGVVAGFAALVLSVLVMLVITQFVELPRNEVVEAMGGAFSWRTVLLVAIFSSTTEEVFFRGFLQPRLGVVPTNILFGFAHLSYGIPMQVVVPMALGFAFSVLTQRRRSIVPAIVAHFVFNGVQLALAKAVADSGLVG